jgi:hypothetical protein
VDAAWDAAYWSRIPLEDRFRVALELSLEQWQLANPGKTHERGLSRSVARVHRG